MKPAQWSASCFFPKTLFERFGIEERFGDPLHPKTDELLRSMVDQIFTEFRALEGFVVRIGETYLEDAPHHSRSILNNTDADKTLIPLVRILREEICIKHCEGDFQRANDFSKVIGEGRHPKVIEVHCTGEYEGKGAYPNFIAHGVIEGFEEHAFMSVEKICSLRDFVERKPELSAGVWT